MKIRIKGNSLRYRLSKTDVQMFFNNGYLEEQTAFGSSSLTYALQVYESNELSANFENNKITVFVPEEITTNWATTDDVGFHETVGVLHLLIEKDFQCLDNTIEDQTDNYPNPSLVC
ncbi:MAG: hypothetical protein AAGC65_10885 [Mucilaginibacter sp.]|uniref:DUF7009 family protein n=1 Tax=Mucilaginibacter sp. TaxID=1882438 RepID=UPI0031AED288